jgi:hypothetical protein
MIPQHLVSPSEPAIAFLPVIPPGNLLLSLSLPKAESEKLEAKPKS